MLIADLLEKRNLTESQLSEQVGIPLDTLLNICRGIVSLQECSDETVRMLARHWMCRQSCLLKTVFGRQNANAPMSLACRTIYNMIWTPIRKD